MIFITGGAYEGKSEYAAKILKISENEILDGKNCISDEIFSIKAVKNFQFVVERLIENNVDTLDFVQKISEKNPDITIISDEIGCGIIPLEKSERIWREETGKACCKIAEISSVVIRICCGIPSVIKGELP